MWCALAKNDLTSRTSSAIHSRIIHAAGKAGTAALSGRAAGMGETQSVIFDLFPAFSVKPKQKGIVMKKTGTMLFVLIFTSLVTVTTAPGQAAGSTWRVDENGPALLSGQIAGFANGSYKLDPLSGLMGWYYPLGPSTSDDLILIEPLVGNTNTVSDLLRFDGQGVFFFSDLEPGELNPDKADVLQIPPPVNPFFVRNEVGIEGNNGALWVPGPGQPGFDASGVLPGLQYNIISDAVPEPNSVVLFLTAAGIWVLHRLRQKAVLTAQ